MPLLFACGINRFSRDNTNNRTKFFYLLEKLLSGGKCKNKIMKELEKLSKSKVQTSLLFIF